VAPARPAAGAVGRWLNRLDPAGPGYGYAGRATAMPAGLRLCRPGYGYAGRVVIRMVIAANVISSSQPAPATRAEIR